MYSDEHIEYLKKIRRCNLRIKLTQWIIVVFLVVLWQWLVDMKIINSFVSSSPVNVFRTLVNLYRTNQLWNHIGVTFLETIISFGLGTIIGVFVASILWWNKFLARVIDPFLTVINSLPKVALGPILIIVAGANMKSIILMALLISVFITIISVYESFMSTDINKIRLLKSLRANKLQIYYKLVLPSNFKLIISTLKISISMSLVGVIMGELLVSKEGIGYLIMYGSQVFNLNLVFTGIIILAILSASLYYILLYVEKKIVKR